MANSCLGPLSKKITLAALFPKAGLKKRKTDFDCKSVTEVDKALNVEPTKRFVALKTFCLSLTRQHVHQQTLSQLYRFAPFSHRFLFVNLLTCQGF
jgi:hypothetical protein